MIDALIEPLRTALRDSEFLHILRCVSYDGGAVLALGGESTRALRDSEIDELVSDGNTAEDWRRVRVAETFQPGRVRHSEFFGCVTLGHFEEPVEWAGGVVIPSGIYRSTVANCTIGHNALIRNVGLLASYVVDERAIVTDCGRVVCEGRTTFGNGLDIPIGPQLGGRWLRAFSEITLDLAIALTSLRSGEIAGLYAEFLADYLRMAESTCGVIGAGSTITNIPSMRNVYVGESVEIDAATRVENSVLLSTPEEQVRIRDGASVCDSILQWGVEVRGPSVVERSVLLEHAVVDRFGIVSNSVIGPNSAVSGAEVTSSLVGPFVGCHHQALLIAARWPGGRGNMGYGASVGCNHTSRVPDQEAILGEGLFIGLGTKLQYPVNLLNSPYSVLATGLSLPPQKIAFPFSLIRPATVSIPGTAPGSNILVPGWMLSENLYAVQRCLLKFRTRDRSTRHVLEHEVFRAEVMTQVGECASSPGVSLEIV